MFCRERVESYPTKNATTIVDVLIIDVSNFEFGCMGTVISSVCQDIMTSTKISFKSIVVLVASLKDAVQSAVCFIKMLMGYIHITWAIELGNKCNAFVY